MLINNNGQIHSGEIWKKTRCLDHEEHINQQLADWVQAQGYQKTDHFRIWKKNNKTVIVCLVDDIRSCSTDYSVDLPYLFDKNTTVITDNYLTCPSMFSLISLPSSFFGIYSYQPEPQIWQPDRDFAFQINRIDFRRFKLMTELAWNKRLDAGYINFNGEDRNHAHLDPKQAYMQFYNDLGLEDQKYIPAANCVADAMPFKNYNFDFDSVPYRVWINLVVETYSSDLTISLSEKIFRALVTPAPWTVYSGRYTVARLESLGFDCMSDIVNHGHYDRLMEIENKLSMFNWKSLEIVDHLKKLGIDQVRQRCLQASAHNVKLLQTFQHRWSSDFVQWISALKV